MGTRYIDVTGTLAKGMWSYRPLVADVPVFEHWRFAEVAERGWEADAYTIATLAGTYLETSKHLFADHAGIEQVPLERFFVPATIAKIPKNAREHITADDLAHAAGAIQPGDALLVSTGWDRYWFDSGETFVMESPHFDLGAMQWIVDHGASMLGGDMPCFDDPQPGGGQDVNRVLFGSGALLLAPLVGLGETTLTRSRLNVLPLKLQGSCGAQCRAIIIEET